MRRVEHILTRIRQSTDNETNVTDLAGVSDDELIEAINDAQAYLQQELEQINSEPFNREVFLTTVARQEAYTLPERTYLGQNLVSVEFSPTPSNVETYTPLRQIQTNQRRTFYGGLYPSYYVLRNRQILLSPIPSIAVTDGLRIVSVQQLPKLDKRRALIADIETDEDTGAINELTVEVDDYADFFAGTTAFSADNILVDDRFSIVDSDGTIIARSVPITAIEEDDDNYHGICTLRTHEPESPLDEIDLTEDGPYYLVAGADATTHSELPIACEPYLITWGKWQLLERDKMFDEAVKMESRLMRLETSIKGAWSRIADDIMYIPVLNSDYLFS